jgi:hypothetical protein
VAEARILQKLPPHPNILRLLRWAGCMLLIFHKSTTDISGSLLAPCTLQMDKGQGRERGG